MDVPVRILHLVPEDLARGAQTFAAELVEVLDEPGQRHAVLRLFDGPPAVLASTESLGRRAGVLRRWGLDPRVVFRLRSRLRQEQPAAVVAHGGEPLKYAALSGVGAAVLVYHKIGVGTPELRNPVRRALYRALVRRADVVAGISPEVLDEVRRLTGAEEERLVLVPNGRDPEPFQGAAQGGRARVRLLFVGHLIESKRPHRFIEVVQAVRARGFDVEAVVVGGGPLLADLRSEDHDGVVEFLGPRDDVPMLLAGSDVFVFTSRPEGEGMPGVLIEAGLAGLPTVATDVPGARVVIDQATTGFVVAVDDVDGMVDAVCRLVADPQLRATMGEAARAWCLGSFTIEASAARWRALLDACLAPTPSPRSRP